MRVLLLIMGLLTGIVALQTTGTWDSVEDLQEEEDDDRADDDWVLPASRSVARPISFDFEMQHPDLHKDSGYTTRLFRPPVL